MVSLCHAADIGADDRYFAIGDGLSRPDTDQLAFLRFSRAAQLDLHVILPDTLPFMDKPDFNR
jgi:hypothetical protein